VKAVAEPRRLRVVAGTAERRWRLAALLGLAAMLALAAYALVVIGPGTDANQMVTVLRAAKSIQAGTDITSDELTTTQLRTQDPSVLATLLRGSDRGRVIGQVAAVDVLSGDLIPADVVSSQFTAGLWDVDVPVRRLPADLVPGDHVALVVSVTLTNGSQGDLVYMQDVQVLGIGQGSVDLWVPATLAPQVEWYADHGGIVLIKMQPGAVQNKIPAGGGA
jgi:hypothetical protein